MCAGAHAAKPTSCEGDGLAVGDGISVKAAVLLEHAQPMKLLSTNETLAGIHMLCCAVLRRADNPGAWQLRSCGVD